MVLSEFEINIIIMFAALAAGYLIGKTETAME